MKQIVSTGSCERIDLAPNRDGFFAVWQQKNIYGGFEIWGQYFTLEATPAAPSAPFRISEDASNLLPHVIPRVTFVSGSTAATDHLLVTWTELNELPTPNVILARALSFDSGIKLIGTQKTVFTASGSLLVYRSIPVAMTDSQGYSLVTWMTSQESVAHGAAGYSGRYLRWTTGNDLVLHSGVVTFVAPTLSLPTDAAIMRSRSQFSVVAAPDSSGFQIIFLQRSYNMTSNSTVDYRVAPAQVMTAQVAWKVDAPTTFIEFAYPAYTEPTFLIRASPSYPTGYSYIAGNKGPAFVIFWSTDGGAGSDVGYTRVYADPNVENEDVYSFYTDATNGWWTRRIAALPTFVSDTGSEYLLTYTGATSTLPDNFYTYKLIKEEGTVVRPPPPTSNSSPPSGGGKKSVWWVVFIVLGILLIAGLAGVGVWYFILKKNKEKEDPDMLKNQMELLAANHAAGENVP
jgi:hypothetical protein